MLLEIIIGLEDSRAPQRFSMTELLGNDISDEDLSKDLSFTWFEIRVLVTLEDLAEA